MKKRLTALVFASIIGIAACSSDTPDDDAQDTTTSTTADTTTTTEDDGDLVPVVGRALGTTGLRASNPDDLAPSESYEPEHNVEPTESAIPMFEG